MSERPASPTPAPSPGRSSPLHAVIHRALAVLTSWAANGCRFMRLRQRRGREPEPPQNAELDTVLSEMGLSPGELVPYLKGHREGLNLRRRMMARLGIGRAEMVPSLEWEIERTCALCPAKARCHRWLQSGWIEGHRDFCPNAARFDLSRWRRLQKP